MMMQVAVIVVFGFIGLAVGIAGYFYQLPKVLRQQRERLGENWKMPVTGWGLDVLAMQTRFGYRFVIPVITTLWFSAVGYYVTNRAMGVK